MNGKEMVKVIMTAYGCTEADAWKTLDEQRYYAGDKTVIAVEYLGVNVLGHVNLRFTLG